MNNPVAIAVLARERLTEAAILHQNGKSDGAFYLAGYSVELMLKAKICERFSIPNLFDEQNQSGNMIPGIGEIRWAVKTHNLDVLLTFAGLRSAFNTDKQINVHLLKASALLFGNWDESSRYRPVGSATRQDVNETINLLTAPRRATRMDSATMTYAPAIIGFDTSEYHTHNLDSETIKSILIERMKEFRALAADRGHPLQRVYLDTAIPGVSDDTYTIKVISDWIGETGQSKALDILIPIFWETFEVGLRKHIFSLFMYAKPEDLFRVSAEQYAIRHAELV